MTRQIQRKQHKSRLLSDQKKVLYRDQGLVERETEQSKQIFTFKSLVLAVVIRSLLYQNAVMANPIGGKVVAGSAQIIQKAPGKLDIIQNSHKAIIDWRGFSIAKGEHTRFRQPSSSAIALNRVRGGQASFINGALTANGNVWLINTNGVLFGKGAQVNVRGLMATTSDIKNDDFMAGRYLFDQPTDNSNAAIVNQGQIEVTDGGSIVLAGPSVSNEGSIKAKLGHVVLASGDTFTMDFHGDGLLQFDIGEPIKQSLADDQTTALVSNQGKITVDGGIVEMTARTRNEMVERVINMEGVIQAKAVGVEGGTIILSGGEQGIVAVSGLLDVSGNEQGQVGGVAKVLGQKVGLLDGAEIDASGDAGGGEILVGGNLHGAGPEQNAMETTVTGDAALNADALNQGDGGKLVVWADELADINGTLSARGGSISGDGGFIETSGKQLLKVSTSPDASALNGQGGTWLIDPTDISIVPPTGVIVDKGVEPSIDFESSTLGADSINNALNGGTSVMVSTSTVDNPNSDQLGNITLEDDATIIKETGGDATLTLQAQNSIFINDNISSTSNKLNVVLNSDSDGEDGGAIVISPGSEIRSNGGDIIMGGGSDPLNNPAIATASNSDFPNNQTKNGIQIGEADQGAANIDAGGGNISIRGEALLDTGHISPHGIAIYSKSIVQTSGSGNIQLEGKGGDGLDINGPFPQAGNISSNSNAIFISQACQIITENGNIELIGVADGEGRENNGVLLQDSKVTSTGTGSISIEGIGGNGNFANRGIYIDGEDSQIFTDSGNITLIGTGGQNSINDSDTNDGVSFLNGGTVQSQTGNITITGTGGFGSKGNQGINLGGSFVDDTVVSTIRSNGGNITLDGVGQGVADNSPDTDTEEFIPGNRSHGIAVFNNGVIETSGNGSISLEGQADNPEQGTSGIFLANFDNDTLNLNIPPPKITSENGNIDLKGTVNSENGSSNTGIILAQGGSIEATGAGSISMEGVGGKGKSGNHGVFVRDSNTLIQTADGNIGFTGTGGDDSTGSTSDPVNNDGISIFNGARVESTGLGNINFVGFAGQGVLDNQGIAIGSSNVGVNTEAIVKTNSGNIDLIGAGSSSSGTPSDFGNHGVFVFDNAVVETDSGSITIEGSSGQNGKGIFAASVFNQQLTPVRMAVASANSTITFRADRLELGIPAEVSGPGILQLEPLDPGLDFSVSLSDAIKDGFSEMFIGHENGSGTVSVSSDGFSFNDNTTLRSPNSGGQVIVDGDVQTNGNDLAILAGSTVDISADLSTSGGRLDVDSGGEVNINGGIDTGGEIAGNTAGAVSIEATDNITIADIKTSSAFGSPNTITLISTAGSIDTTAGSLDSSSQGFGDAADARIEAAGNIVTANISASSTNGNGGGIVLSSQNGAINTLGIDAGTGIVNLSAGETSETTDSNLTLNADVIAQSVSLKAGDAIIQTAGSILSGQLGIEAESQTTLASADIDVLAARITGVGNSFSFSDPNDFELGQVSNIAGITTNNGSVNLQAANSITFTENVITDGGDFELFGNAFLSNETLISTNGGNINLNGLVDGNVSLTLAAGRGGNIRFFDNVGSEIPLGPVRINSANDVTIDGQFIAGDTRVSYLGDFFTGPNGFLDLNSLFISPDARSANLRGKIAGAEEKDTALAVNGPIDDPNFVINDCVIGVDCSVPVDPDPIPDGPNTGIDPEMLFAPGRVPTEAEPRPGMNLPTSAEPGTDGIEFDVSGLPEVMLVLQQRRPSNNPTAYQYSNFGNTELWDNVPGAYSISSFAAFSPKETKAKETPAGAETSQGEQP